MTTGVVFFIKDDAWFSSHGEIFGQRRDRDQFFVASARAGRSDRIISFIIGAPRAVCTLPNSR